MTPEPTRKGDADPLAAGVRARELAAFDAAFDQSQVGIAIFDEQLRFVRINGMLAELNRRPVEAHLGRTVTELFGAPGLGTEAVLRRALVEERPLVGVELSGEHPDVPGEVRHFEATYTPIRGADGRVVGVSAVVLEVTDRRRVAAQRDELLAAERRAAEQAERLRERAERAAARSQLRAEIGTALEATRGTAERARRLLDLLVPRFADFGTVELAPTPNRPRLAAAAHRDGRGLMRLRALRERHARAPDAAPGTALLLGPETPQMIEELTPALLEEHAPDEEALALLRALAPRSLLAVPLAPRRRVLGGLVLSRSDGRRPFDADEFVFAQDLAARAALSIENERLYERERGIALELQRSLLAGDLPRDDRLGLAVRYRPTPGELELVGGDWHDAVARPDGRTALLVGDIVGHGLASAAAMGQLRSAARALALSVGEPGELLRELDAFAAITPGAAYATVACAFLHPETGALSYACAGHLPPLLVSGRGRPRHLTGGRSLPLAADSAPARRRRSARARLPPGGTLLLYTDGLVERRDVGLEAGLDRLVEVVAELGDRAVDELPDAVARAMLADGRQRDDVVVLAVRREPSAAEPQPAASRAQPSRTPRTGVRSTAT